MKKTDTQRFDEWMLAKQEWQEAKRSGLEMYREAAWEGLRQANKEWYKHLGTSSGQA